MIAQRNLDDLRGRLVERAEEICRHLVPGGKRSGNRWICGGIDGGPGKSMEVMLEGEKAGLWIDRATDDKGDMIGLWKACRSVDFKEAIRLAADFLGMRLEEAQPKGPRVLDPSNFRFDDNFPGAELTGGGPPPLPSGEKRKALDWDKCIEDFDDAQIKELSEWRGFSVGFVRRLKEERLIGLHRGNIALPVHDKAGNVVRVHVKMGDTGWAYYPKGGETSPLIIGDPQKAIHTLACESQWDAFSLLDKLEAWKPENIGTYAAICTRGATTNCDFSKFECQHLIACPQNDPDSKRSQKTGRTPAEEWLHQVSKSRNKNHPFTVFQTPIVHEDANAWIQEANPDHYDVFNEVVLKSKNPLLTNIRNGHEILATPIKDDPNALIGYERRFLSRGGSWLVIGQSGIGKSTLTASLGLHAAVGVAWQGMKFRKPLKVLVVQAENDEGDLHEMLAGNLSASDLTEKQKQQALSNIQFLQQTTKTGDDFCGWLEEVIREVGAELVFIDPTLSYVGDDISLQKVASHFLRNGLQPILQRTGAIVVLIHHTGKPPKDSKSYSHWGPSDFAYLGLGSSEITNWARAVSVLIPLGGSGAYKFLTAKRGGRIGLINQFTGESTSTIHLRHSDHGLGWVQCEEPAEEEITPKKGGRKQSVTTDHVIAAIGNDSTAMRKDKLISTLAVKYGASERTVRERVDSCLTIDLIHVHETEPRPSGGKPYVWLREGPAPNGNNQTETAE